MCLIFMHKIFVVSCSCGHLQKCCHIAMPFTGGRMAQCFSMVGGTTTHPTNPSSSSTVKLGPWQEVHGWKVHATTQLPIHPSIPHPQPI